MRWAAFITLAILLGSVGIARAEPPSAPIPPAMQNGASSDREFERSRLLVEAQRAHEGGQHAIALGLASAALSIRESASLWRFVAEQHWLLGESGAARRASERCLARIATEPPSPNRAAVEQGCRFIQARTSRATPPGDERHAARRRPADSGDAQTGTRATGLPRSSTSASAGRGRRGFDRTRWSIVAVGVGVSALVTAAIARLVANGRYDALKRQCATGCPDDKQEIQGRVQDLDSLSAGLAVGGTLVAALGATEFLLPGSRHPVVQGARVQIVVPF
jgi:hypothetical protein